MFSSQVAQAAVGELTAAVGCVLLLSMKINVPIRSSLLYREYFSMPRRFPLGRTLQFLIPPSARYPIDQRQWPLPSVTVERPPVEQSLTEIALRANPSLFRKRSADSSTAHGACSFAIPLDHQEKSIRLVAWQPQARGRYSLEFVTDLFLSPVNLNPRLTSAAR